MARKPYFILVERNPGGGLQWQELTEEWEPMAIYASDLGVGAGEFVLHRQATYEGPHHRWWSISEAKSGHYIASAWTRADAILKAQDVLAEFNGDFQAAVDEVVEVNGLSPRYEEQ